MNKAPLLKEGDRVLLTYESRTVEAVVCLASDNGHALFLSFDALVGGYAGQMPVLWKDGAYSDLMFGQLVTIEQELELTQ